jgi:hypothetical protein
MKVAHRSNLLWGFVLLALTGFALAYALGLVPPSIWDAALRAAPALLVLAGLSLLFRGRVPLGGLLALLLTVGLVFGVALVAFSQRTTQQRTDNVQGIAQSISPDITLLRVILETLDTDIEVQPSLDSASGVTGEFLGSLESDFNVSYEVAADNSATLTIRESRENTLPMLEQMGRGTLSLELPSGIPLDVQLVGQSGDVVLNMNGLNLERINADLARGDLVATLPSYTPLLTERGELLGTLDTQNGTLTLLVPSDVAARLELNRGGGTIEPQYDPTIYNYLVGDVLESRAIDSAATAVRYALVAPRGEIRVQTLS